MYVILAMVFVIDLLAILMDDLIINRLVMVIIMIKMAWMIVVYWIIRQSAVALILLPCASI